MKRVNRKSKIANRNWLPDMDLNHDKQIQSLLCYRYTIGQTERMNRKASNDGVKPRLGPAAGCFVAGTARCAVRAAFRSGANYWLAQALVAGIPPAARGRGHRRVMTLPRGNVSKQPIARGFKQFRIPKSALRT